MQIPAAGIFKEIRKETITLPSGSKAENTSVLLTNGGELTEDESLHTVQYKRPTGEVQKFENANLDADSQGRTIYLDNLADQSHEQVREDGTVFLQSRFFTIHAHPATHFGPSEFWYTFTLNTDGSSEGKSHLLTYDQPPCSGWGDSFPLGGDWFGAAPSHTESKLPAQDYTVAPDGTVQIKSGMTIRPLVAPGDLRS